MTNTNATDLSKKTQRCSITPLELDAYMSNVSILASYVQLLRKALANSDNDPLHINSIESHIVDIDELISPIIETASEIFSVIRKVQKNEK